MDGESVAGGGRRREGRGGGGGRQGRFFGSHLQLGVERAAGGVVALDAERVRDLVHLLGLCRSDRVGLRLPLPLVRLLDLQVLVHKLLPQRRGLLLDLFLRVSLPGTARVSGGGADAREERCAGRGKGGAGQLLKLALSRAGAEGKGGVGGGRVCVSGGPGGGTCSSISSWNSKIFSSILRLRSCSRMSALALRALGGPAFSTISCSRRYSTCDLRLTCDQFFWT
eukprot:SAG31_NODE_7553_length_1657_cov_1.191271_2_plen_225_part_00